jgi:uncharacterized cupredoxin-like copper-binding protein
MLTSPAMKRLRLLICVAAVPLFAACSQQPTSNTASTTIAPVKLTIEAKEFAFSPAKATVKVGQTVEVDLKNTGVTAHDFTIEKINLKDKAVAHGDEHAMDNMGGMDPDKLPVHVAAEASHSGTVTFTPSEAGEYEFFCTVAGHKVSGMVGRLTVVAP